MNTIVNFSLSEEDYLAFQLFYASKSKKAKKARNRNWISLVIIFACFAYFTFFRDDDLFLFYYFLVFVALTTFLFPVYSRYRYKKHYLNHIREVYENSFDKENELIFTNETIDLKDYTGTSNIIISQIIEINEIEKYYFLHISLAQAIIIPKEKIKNLSETDNTIKEIAEKFKIKYNIDLNWKWK